MPSERARAKVNLYLRVIGRRTDGYHLLDSLAVFPGAADLLHAEPGDALTLEIEGPFAGRLEGENLVLRAAEALLEATGRTLGARLRLEKHLPVASGIGGGSADAAAVLRLLNRMWSLGLAPAELAGLALGLGADVPVCLLSEPSRMGGIGELLGVAPALPEGGILLANPGYAVSTPEIFRARDVGFSAPATLPASWPDMAAMVETLAGLGNDLEAPAIRLCPAIAETLAWLGSRDGCLLARMSGSGATCFALFPTEAAARQAAAAAPSGSWVWSGGMERAATSLDCGKRAMQPGDWGVAKR